MNKNGYGGDDDDDDDKDDDDDDEDEDDNNDDDDDDDGRFTNKISRSDCERTHAHNVVIFCWKRC